MSDIVKAYLSNPDTPATVLGVICTDMMSTDFLSYEIETVTSTLEDTYGVVLPEENVDKLASLQVVYTTNAFYMSIPTFIAVVDAFNANGVDFNQADLPHPADMAWAITEVLMNVPEQESPEIFHPDVLAFISAVMLQEGFTSMPSSLSFLGRLPVPDVSETFLDDPDVYAAYSDQQSARAKEVDDYVASRVQAVISACAELPLKNRDQESWDKLARG